MTPMQMHVLSLSVSVGREVMLKVAALHSTAQHSTGRQGRHTGGREDEDSPSWAQGGKVAIL